MPGTAARQAPPLAIGSDAQVLALSSRPLSMVPGRDIPARRRRQNVRAARLTGQVGSTHARLLALPNEWNAPDASRRPQQSTSRWSLRVILRPQRNGLLRWSEMDLGRRTTWRRSCAVRRSRRSPNCSDALRHVLFRRLTPPRRPTYRTSTLRARHSRNAGQCGCSRG